MPSTTRGSILISTANDIGEALVEKLGGVGYSPNEWKEKYNLCGIAPVDSAPALSVLADSAGTGDERGSILIATADAIGAILNKKYNVLRGFKPKEWASACRKMKALEEGSVASASIASFSDGADNVPTKSLVVTIPPTLSGVSSVSETQTGRNVRQNVTDYSSVNPVFFQYRNYYAGQATGYPKLEGTFKTGTYTLSFDTSASITASKVGVWAKKKSDQNWYNLSANGDLVTPTSSGYSFCSASFGHVTGTFKINEECDALGFGYYQYGISIPYTNLMLEIGSTAHAYEPYQTPTTYTASLGRTIYGGQVDIVNGVGKDTRIKKTVRWGDLGNVTQLADVTRKEIVLSASETPKYIAASASTDLLNDKNLPYDMTYSGNFEHIYIANTARIWVYLPNGTDANTEITVSYTLDDALQTDFTFDGQEVPTRLGYNAFWSDSGDTAVEYYQAPTPYARKTATGGIANFSDQRTDLPLTKAIANIAPSIAGKSAVNLVRTGASLANIADVSGNMTNSYFYNIGSDYVLTAGTTYKIAMEVNSTVTPFAVSVGVGDNAYRYDIYNTGINNKNGVVAFEFTVEASHLATWNKLWIRAPRYSSPSEPSTPTTCTFTVKNITLYSTATTYTAELVETVYGGSVDFVSGEVKQVVKKKTVSSFGGTYGAVNNGYAYYITDADTTHNTSAVNPTMMIANQLFTYGSSSRGNAPTWQYGGNDGSNQTHTFILPSEYDTLAKANNFLANLETPLEVTLTLTTPTESAIPGRVISPIEGVNNYWNDAGGDTEIQYFENEA